MAFARRVDSEPGRAAKRHFGGLNGILTRKDTKEKSWNKSLRGREVPVHGQNYKNEIGYCTSIAPGSLKNLVSVQPTQLQSCQSPPSSVSGGSSGRQQLERAWRRAIVCLEVSHMLIDS